MVCCVCVGLLRLTPISFTVPPACFIASVKPLQRCSSAALPTSWLTHSACLTPAAAIFWPPPSPAWYSVCPTCTSTPRLLATSAPELIEITGIPAETAERIEVRNRDNQPIRVSRDRSVDQVRHGHHIKGGRRFVDHLNAHILRRLVNAFLDH